MGFSSQGLDEINTVSGEVVFSNEFVSLKSSNGDDRVAVTVGSGQGAVALVLWKNKALMFRTPRYAIDSVEWELPRAGALEGEELLETALRCVEGWTGVVADESSAVLLGTMTPDSEILTNEVALFALSASSGAIRANHENSKWIDIDELVTSCLDGEIEDSFTCMAVLRARLNGTI